MPGLPLVHRSTLYPESNAFIERRLELEDTGEEAEDLVYYCSFSCNGRKHARHSDCDTSCDRPCIGHPYSGELPKQTLNIEAIQNACDQMQSDSERFTGQRTFHATFGSDFQAEHGQGIDLLIPAYSQIVRDSVPDISPTECLAVQPCSFVRIMNQHKVYKIKLKWSYTRVVTLDDGSTRTIQGPKGDREVGRMLIPQAGKNARYEGVRCWCEYNYREPDRRTALHIPSGGILIDEGQGERVASSGDVGKLGLEVVCRDMNTATIACSNTSTKNVKLVLEPGVHFIPEDPAYQVMGLASRAEIVLLAGESRSYSAELALMRGPSETKEPVQAHVLCLNMQLKEPNDGVKYRAMPGGDPSSIAAASMTAKSRFRGPWEQTRAWIVTDRATFEEVRKRLFPPPTEGIYLRSLWEAAVGCGLETRGVDLGKLISPKLLSGSTAPPAAAGWLIARLDESQPKALAAWVKTELKALLSKALGGQDFEQEYAVLLAAGLGMCRDGGVFEAAAGTLAGLSASEREKLSRTVAAVPFLMSLNQADSKRAELGLRVVEALRPPAAPPCLAGVNPALSEGIKQKAKALLDSYRDG